MSRYESLDRLNDIHQEMSRLIEEAEGLVRADFPESYPNAEAYWLAHLKCALGGHGYHTYSTTFLSFLESGDEEEEEGDWSLYEDA